MHFDIHSLSSSDTKQDVLASYRRFTAFVALIFPIVAVVFIFLGLSKAAFQKETLLRNSLFFQSLILGLPALAFWIIRFCKPAFFALGNRNPAISIGERYIWFFGRSYIISKSMSLDVIGSKIFLNDAGVTTDSRVIFFIRSKTLNINE